MVHSPIKLICVKTNCHERLIGLTLSRVMLGLSRSSAKFGDRSCYVGFVVVNDSHLKLYTSNLSK